LIESRNWVGCSVAALLIVLIATGFARANECIACHKKPEFFAQYPKLNDYYREWVESPHAQSGITCDRCHGGNPKASSSRRAHSGVLPMSDTGSKLHYQRQPKTCGRCHSDIRDEFTQSKHFAALTGQRTAPTCTTCHPAMSQRPDYRLIVLNACRNCHGEGNSEGLPVITADAENLFHQLNIVEGLLGWARIHYQSRSWPGDSRVALADIEERYQKTLNWVHQFDLGDTSAETSAILAELTQLFEAARRDFEARTEPDGDAS